ncbi:hypothetical protein [Nakamurella multipartita]|uniref:Uncharacterized protein n=1 Tax=Nakamurella multipartita (strain ATCC 700099 / DSM 44233 / CIP 104796 / JCM 9543 / NBRC 105858 / Y-104) TaxID=479431 RepID=C8X8E3_NAKMY|nr:hypothetical protein [Nakamurella multipartita]ACV77119.1 hypothetical protein Namu_0705 [Nakamurella multipartita DSM 44233]
MTAIGALTEVAGRAVQAEATVRSAAWQDQGAIDAATQRVDRALRVDREALSRPALDAVQPSGRWRYRLDQMLMPDRDVVGQAPPEDLVEAAAQAAADADAAVATARLALLEAHRAVLQARGAALRAGDSDAVAATVRGYRPLAGNPTLSHGKELGTGVSREMSAVLRAKPRSILVKLGISLGLGLAYLGFIRLYQWDEKSELAPFLALYALSGVIGGVVCTNALSWDATRVREALTSGRRLWHVMLSKNLTMFVLVGAVGVVLSVLLAWRTGAYGTSLVKALGQLVTMMLLWLGVGNVLSVVSPLRVEPLKARFKDGTLKPFLLSFVVSYVLGLGVNLMLTWRVWAKQSMIDELGGVTLPVLTLVLSGLLIYLLLTVLAVNLADQPRFRRALLREMVDYKALKSTAPAASGPAGA